MMTNMGARLLVVMLSLLSLFGTSALWADEQLARTVANIKPAIVGIGTYSIVKQPAARLLGTGFVVGDGLHVATNFHVAAVELDTRVKEGLVVFISVAGARPSVGTVQYRAARITAVDEQHDLALLAMDGPPLPALTLGDDIELREGASIAFTGFPIGAVLGLVPVTHQGIVSALTPVATRPDSAKQLTANKIAALRDPFTVLQLDATAYPGNSGSPVYAQDSGKVVGVINQVFVKGKKEDMLREPSAITYAIPVRYLSALLARH
jgi:serine protease Do